MNSAIRLVVLGSVSLGACPSSATSTTSRLLRRSRMAATVAGDRMSELLPRTSMTGSRASASNSFHNGGNGRSAGRFRWIGGTRARQPPTGAVAPARRLPGFRRRGSCECDRRSATAGTCDASGAECGRCLIAAAHARALRFGAKMRLARSVRCSSPWVRRRRCGVFRSWCGQAVCAPGPRNAVW